MDAKRYVVSPLHNHYVSKTDFFHSHRLAWEAGADIPSEGVVRFIDSTREDLEDAACVVENKYQTYIDVLGARLNRLHNRNYSKVFWQRVFTLELLRHITCLHQFYSYAERGFDRKRHSVVVLDRECFVYAEDYEHQRELLTSEWIGQEQLFALYIMHKGYDDLETFFHSKASSKAEKQNKGGKRELFLQLLHSPGKGVQRFLRKVRKIILDRNATRVGLTGCLFEGRHIEDIHNRTLGRVKLLDVPDIKRVERIDDRSRRQLSDTCEFIDDFDRFFFFSLEYLMPKYLIEGFELNEAIYSKLLKENESLKAIASETLLGSSSVNLFRAIAYEQRGVQSIYCEHNCFYHPYVGSPTKIIYDSVDQYLTIGWTSKDADAKRKSLGSLFPFRTTISEEKSIDILYVSYTAEQVRTLYSALYHYMGSCAQVHLKSVKEFFEALPKEALGRISYRGYPKDYFIRGLRYDKEYFIRDFLDQTTIVSSWKSEGESCKSQMARSRIVVTDALSTSYLESLVMDIPVICYVNRASLHLKSEYDMFFDDLVKAGILHFSGKSAAAHLSSIYHSPEKWWRSEKTERLKYSWKKRNLGDPSLLKDFLINAGRDS